ncbi:MAG: hypothetical protein AAF367_00600 [Pseudomonadota bacterium]
MKRAKGLTAGLAGAMVLAAGSAWAATFGVEDRGKAAAFRAEAEAIAKGAPTIERSTTAPTAKEDKLLKAHDLLQEAYRTDPAATLDLIRRIIEATNE